MTSTFIHPTPFVQMKLKNWTTYNIHDYLIMILIFFSSIVTSCGRTREDPDGLEHLILGFFALVLTASFGCYPGVAYILLVEDLVLYNHVLYLFQTFLPSSTALIVVLGAGGILAQFVMSIAFLFAFLIGGIMLVYVVTQTLWMTYTRDLW